MQNTVTENPVSIGRHTNRDELIDVEKGIGILLVLIGHIPNLSSSITHFIFAFHMPLFVFLSGIYFSTKRFINNIRRLFYVYLKYSISLSLIYVFFMRLIRSKIPGGLVGIMRSIIMGGGAPYRIEASPAMWFLISLIIVEFIAFLFQPLNNVTKLFFAFLLISFALLCNGLSIDIFFNILPSFILFPFFLIGNVYGKKINERIDYSSSFFLVLTLTLVLFYVEKCNDLVNIFRMQYGNSIILYYVASFIGIVLIRCICSILSSCIVVRRILAWFGRNTIPFMCTHQFVYLLIDNILSDFMNNHYVSWCLSFFSAIVTGFLITLIKFKVTITY